MNIFIVIIAVLFTLILYLIYLLYSRFKNDTINDESVGGKLEEIEMLNLNKKILNKNIIMTLKQNNDLFKIELELYDKSLPITCKNFRNIAFKGLKNKTYKNTKFYKIYPEKYIIGGDILNNNGSGEISLYGKNFIDESFKYNHDHAGVLSMINNGPNTNNCKFMITTQCCPELNGKHVVFGKVVSGLYNIFKLSKSKTLNNIPIDDIEIIDISYD